MAVDLSFFQSSVADELRDEGRAEGVASGIAQGKAEDITLLLDRRGVSLSIEDRQRITSCEDLDLLGHWFDRAITATWAAEVFSEPGHDAF